MSPPNKQEDNSPDQALKRAIWNDPALIEALQKSDATLHNYPQAAVPTGKLKTRAWSVALAASVLVTLLSWPLLRGPTASAPSQGPAIPSQHFTFAEATEVTLTDGSEVALNRQASLLFTETSAQRNATLTKGEAFFAVKKDPKRLFTVATGHANIMVLGTAFNVDKTLQQTTIDVFHGKVAVTTADKSKQVELVKGQRARVDSSGIAVSSHAIAAPDWQTGWLDLDNVSITDAVYQLNRYAEKPVVLQNIDDSLRVSGWFKTSDITGAATLIAESNSLSITSLDDSIVLSPGESHPNPK